MSKVRLEDVARDAGVSMSTATRVIRGSGRVTEEKQRRVLASIVKLGYVAPPPQNRQPIESGRLIGHILRKTSANPLFARLLDSVNELALSGGYHVIAITVDDSYTLKDLMDHIQALLAFGVAGIIMSSLGDTIDFALMQSFLTHVNKPIVMVERVADLMGVNKVVVDPREGLLVAARHLIERGHRRIAYIAPDWDAQVERLRLDGFRETLDRAGLGEGMYLACASYGAQEGYDALTRCAQAGQLPTAIIGNDALLSGAQQYLYEHRIRVPDQVSLIGTDDTLAPMFSPPLTSLAFPERAMAQTAIDIILDTQSHAIARTVMLSAQLIERHSVAPPPDEPSSSI